MAAEKKKAAKAPPKKGAKASSKKAAGDLISDLVSSLRTEAGGPFVLGSDEMALKIKGVISTQCPTLDAAIGRGGVPTSRLTIIHGPEASGKTTIALHLCAEVQRRGGLVYYMDKEYKLDPDYAQKLGVDTKKFVISQPDCLEDACDEMKHVIRFVAERRKKGERKPILFLLDSINATQSKVTIEAETASRGYPNEALVWSKQLPEIVKLASKENIALVFISQVRKKLNVMFGDDNAIAGGEAPKFHASLVMFVNRIGSEKKEVGKQKERVANIIQVECKKNQIAPPFRKAKLVIRYGTGIDFEESLLTQAEEAGLIKKVKAHYVYEGGSIGKSRDAAIKFLRENEDDRDAINAKLREKWS